MPRGSFLKAVTGSAVVAVLLPGCGGGESPPAEPTQTASSTRSSPSVTPSTSVAAFDGPGLQRGAAELPGTQGAWLVTSSGEVTRESLVEVDAHS